MRMFKATWPSLEVRDSQVVSDGDMLFSRSHVYATSRQTNKQADWALLQQLTLQQGGILDLRPFHWDAARPTPTQRPNPGPPRRAHNGVAVDCQAIIRQPSSDLVRTLV